MPRKLSDDPRNVKRRERYRLKKEEPFWRQMRKEALTPLPCSSTEELTDSQRAIAREGDPIRHELLQEAMNKAYAEKNAYQFGDDIPLPRSAIVEMTNSLAVAYCPKCRKETRFNADGSDIEGETPSHLVCMSCMSHLHIEPNYIDFFPNTGCIPNCLVLLRGRECHVTICHPLMIKHMQRKYNAPRVWLQTADLCLIATRSDTVPRLATAFMESEIESPISISDFGHGIESGWGLKPQWIESLNRTVIVLENGNWLWNYGTNCCYYFTKRSFLGLSHESCICDYHKRVFLKAY